MTENDSYIVVCDFVCCSKQRQHGTVVHLLKSVNCHPPSAVGLVVPIEWKRAASIDFELREVSNLTFEFGEKSLGINYS